VAGDVDAEEAGAKLEVGAQRVLGQPDDRLGIEQLAQRAVLLLPRHEQLVGVVERHALELDLAQPPAF